MDIFEQKNIKPMLIGDSQEAFDSSEHIFELKLDGIRCIAYLDEEGVELRNKRNVKMLPKIPELANINKQIKKRCILDGELIIVKDGKPNFFEIQRRSLMSNLFKIELASTRLPASFIAFDILYNIDHDVTNLPLMQRKDILNDIIIETERIAISRYIEKSGISFYNLAEKNHLEGIVAKKINSKYYFGKRTKDWIKIKHLDDDDFVICGYYTKENNMTKIILGQYQNNLLIYKGSVLISQSSSDFRFIKDMSRISAAPFKLENNVDKDIIWVEPNLVCTVKYMMLTASGSMRQPVFKGLRKDKSPKECIVKKT